MGALWGATFVDTPFFPPGIWDVENRIILDNVSRLFGLSLFVLGHSSLLGVGLGLSIKRVGVVKFFGPTLVNPQINAGYLFKRNKILMVVGNY